MIRSLYTQLNEQGKRVVFKPGSILIPASISESKLTEIANLTTDALIKDLDYNRDIVLPTVAVTTEVVKTNVGKYVPDSPIGKFSIVQHSTPSIVSQLEEKQMLNSESYGFRGISERHSFSIPFVNQSGTKEGFMEQFMTPFESLNEEIKAFILQYTVEDIENIWDKYMGGASASNRNFEFDNLASPVKMNEVILMFIIASKIESTPPWDIKFNLNTYVGVMKEVYSYFHDAVRRIILNSKQPKNDTVVLHKFSIESKDVIYVNKENYLKFLADGGSSDIVLGAVISEPGDAFTAKELKDSKVRFLSNLSSFIATASQEEKLKQLEVYKSVVYNAVVASYEDLTDKEMEDIVKRNGLNSDVELKNKVHQYILDFVAKTELLDLDLTYMTEQVLADVIFANTSASVFLSKTREYRKTLNTDEAKKIVAFASMDIIGGYILNQLDIV